MALRSAEVELVLSGGAGRRTASARAGFLPVPLRRVPSAALRDIPVYLRARPDGESDGEQDEFLLYRSVSVGFAPEDRERLLENGRQFVYIPVAEQARFQRRVERALAATAQDTAREGAERAALVYETSVELMNEVLADADGTKHAARVQEVSRAVTTLVLNDPQAFRHLLATSRHDFYTATHMVNVGTWMVPVAYALGHRGEAELSEICQAGLLHDLGKVLVPTDLLNKRDPLTPEDWSTIRNHALLGGNRLAGRAGEAPLVPLVARQHHERMDGSGYPAGLRGDEIHPVSRICAVVDTFDAMTALRPFKRHAMSVSEAIVAIKAETPAKYDPAVVEVWLALLNQADDCELAANRAPESEVDTGRPFGRRRNQRFACDCPVLVHALRKGTRGRVESPAIEAVAHSASRFGLGLLSPVEFRPGERLRIRMQTANGSVRIVHGRSVRCSGYDDGWFEVGVELFRPRARAHPGSSTP